MGHMRAEMQSPSASKLESDARARRARRPRGERGDTPLPHGPLHPSLTPAPSAPASALHEAAAARGVTREADCWSLVTLKNSQFLKIFRPLRGHWRSAHAKHAALAYGARHRGMLEA